MAIDAVEDTLIRRKVGRNKRESCGKRLRIEVIGYIQDIRRQRPSRSESLIHTENSRLGIHELGFQDSFDGLAFLVQVMLVASIQGDIEAETEELLLPLLKLVAQTFDVL